MSRGRYWSFACRYIEPSPNLRYIKDLHPLRLAVRRWSTSRDTPYYFVAGTGRQPPPPRGHTPRLQASVRRNLSQFELDNVGMEDASGVMVI
jgi:hypothetical protein